MTSQETAPGRHLSPEQFEGYRRRTLTPAELLEVDDHLSDCARCRDLLLGQMLPDAGIDSSEEPETELPHFSADDMAAHADGVLDPDENEWLETHIVGCTQCAVLLSDVKLVRRVAARAAAPLPRSWRRYRVRAGMAAAAVLVPLVVWGVTTPLRRELASLHAEHRRALEANEMLRRDRERLAAAADRLVHELSVAQDERPRAAAAVTLNDDSGRVVLDVEGRIRGLGALDSRTEGLLRATLNAGRVRIPTGLLGLIAETSVPRGATDVPTFTPLYPVGMTVESDTPLFRWQPQAGAAGYVVTVYDSRFDVVASSPIVVLPEWRPRKPLERGGLYSWLVRTPKADLESETAGSLAPEARFKVLDADKGAELSVLRRRTPRSHLLLGTLYAQVGLFDEADAELQQLTRLNPGSRLAAALLDSLRAARGGDEKAGHE